METISTGPGGFDPKLQPDKRKRQQSELFSSVCLSFLCLCLQELYVSQESIIIIVRLAKGISVFVSPQISAHGVLDQLLDISSTRQNLLTMI